MTESIGRGPNVGLGALVGNVTTSAGQQVAALDPYDGPGLDYQGAGWPDPRFIANKDGLGTGRIPAFFSAAPVVLVDALPSASTATPADIAALQATTNGTAMTLVSSQASVANNGQCQHMPACPLIPNGASAPISVFGLDMGFVYGTTTAGSGTVTVVDSTVFQLGRWVVIGGAGAAGKPLITQVTNPSLSATTITTSPAAVTAVTRAPISSGNAYIGFPANVQATGVSPFVLGGVSRFFNAAEGVARSVGITAAAGAAGGIFTVVGYDIYGFAMTEAITVGAGAAVAYGNKCFKYIVSITPNVTDASAHYSAGVGDVIGMNIRSGRFEYLYPFVAGAQIVITGWKAGLTAPNGPSSSTTADVRGSIQVGTRGNNTGSGSAGATGGPFSGTVRITVSKMITTEAQINSTPNSAVNMFGLAQA